MQARCMSIFKNSSNFFSAERSICKIKNRDSCPYLNYLGAHSCLRFCLTSYAQQPLLNGSHVTSPGFFFPHFIGFQFRNALLCFGPHFCCLPRTSSRVNMQKPYTKSTHKNFVNQIAERDVWTLSSL